MKELDENQLNNVSGGMQNGPSGNTLCMDQCLHSKGMNPTQEDRYYCQKQCANQVTKNLYTYIP